MFIRSVFAMSFVGLFVVSLAGAPQAPAPAENWRAIAARVDAAALADDAPGLKQGRADLLRVLSAAPAGSDATMTRYAIAYAGWRLSTSPATPSKERDALLDDAEAQLKAALKTQPTSAEALALLSSVYGLMIANSPLRGITLGSRSSGAIEDALRLEPNNPRVVLCRGVGKFNTPGMFGGSVKEAETQLRRAIELFDATPGEAPFPNWGRFDAHVWLGQVLAKRGDKTGARAEYDKALAVAPQSGWVRYVLLPALDKK